jgi:hypothetical protein
MTLGAISTVFEIRCMLKVGSGGMTYVVDLFVGYYLSTMGADFFLCLSEAEALELVSGTYCVLGGLGMSL